MQISIKPRLSETGPIKSLILSKVSPAVRQHITHIFRLMFMHRVLYICIYYNTSAARAAMQRESQARGIRVSEGTINAWLELKFGRLQPDPQLQSYLRMFRAELAAVEGRGDGE